MRRERRIHNPEGKPTVRQIYGIARLLCARTDEEWPETREQASELIEQLRGEDESPDASRVLA